MTRPEILQGARRACRYPTGHPDDVGPAVPHLTPYGIVVDTPAGVFELRAADGTRLTQRNLATYLRGAS